MIIKHFHIVWLTRQTCKMHNALAGIACNKSIFLLQKDMQPMSKRDARTWTVENYENDRFGLLNGAIYLRDQSKGNKVTLYFRGNDIHDTCCFKISADMSFSEISKLVDTLYPPANIGY